MIFTEEKKKTRKNSTVVNVFNMLKVISVLNFTLCLLQKWKIKECMKSLYLSQTISVKDKVDMLNKFCQKMINSGHSVKSIRVVLVGGIRGYKRKLTRSLERGEPVHRSSQQSAGSRRTKKLLAKNKWFREEGKPEDEIPAPWAGPGRVTEKRTGQTRGTGTRVAQESSSIKHLGRE